MLTLLSTALFLSPFAQEPAPCPSQQATVVAQKSECQKSCDEMTLAAKKQCHTSEETSAIPVSLNQKLAECHSSCASKAASCSNKTAVCEGGASAQIVALEVKACESARLTDCEETTAVQLVTNTTSQECEKANCCGGACKDKAAAQVVDMEIASNTTPYVTQEAIAMKLAGDAKKILSRFAIEENPCACCEDTPATQVISIGRKTDCDKDNCDTCSAGNPALEIASAADTKAPLIAEENRACSSGCQSGCEEIYVVENVMTSGILPNSELAHMVGIEVVDSESVKLAERMARIEARLMRIETLLNQLASQL